MKRKATRRLRVKKDTLRSLSADEAAQVRGGKQGPPLGPGLIAHPNAPIDTRYCLIWDWD